ncbi:MAG TPA: diguanylate cyclase [Solirubrobacteraceae bacterium]|jgi:diguanylate cyclase (GGDEF)-like protein|nr:diguanylate cyclase [Solirubrobacteraceae bacterium]
MISFRSRLTSFFILIVVVPMAAVGFLVFRLIDDSQSGKADARASGVASAAATVYESASSQASLRARTLAGDLALVPVAKLDKRAATFAAQLGLARVTIQVGARPVVDIGNRTAIAPGIALVTAAGKRPARTVTASQLTASAYANELASPGVDVVVRSGATTLASTLPGAAGRGLPTSRGSVTIGSNTYHVLTQRFSGFDHAQIAVSVLSNPAATGGSVGADRVLAAVFIAGFLILAFFFSLLASRALHGQLSQFLGAARRLAGGDFSEQVPTTGSDEFALLGQEFNNMSEQLERRLAELEQERSRVRKSIRRIGEAFASGLDRDALLELALKTAMDATNAERGRVSARQTPADPLQETIHVGRLAGLEGAIYDAERRALAADGVGEASVEDAHLATVALGSIAPGGPTHGLITVCREGRGFTEDDLELLRSLASQATLAMANVNLHYDVQRQAITDDLTALATHGHFQELLSAEMDEVRRYHYPVGLIMLDIDNFKSVNDVYGHQQGDLVLHSVADALRSSSRDVDVAARYGGEEMALILPHTDLEGAYEAAERARMAIEALQIPLLDGQGTLRVTTSVGAAASSDGNKNELIAAADGALYVAKREGKNRTVRASAHTANVVGGE